MVSECCRKELELIMENLELKIKKNLKQTEIKERDDLAQEIKIKIIEKMPELLDEKVPSFFEFAIKEISQGITPKSFPHN